MREEKRKERRGMGGREQEVDEEEEVIHTVKQSRTLHLNTISMGSCSLIFSIARYWRL